MTERMTLSLLTKSNLTHLIVFTYLKYSDIILRQNNRKDMIQMKYIGIALLVILAELW